VPKSQPHRVVPSTSRVERLEFLERENAQLREALSSRIVIEQAKGVLAERFRLDVDEAFELLRRAARSHRMPMHLLAAAVASGTTTPAEIEAAMLRLPSSNGDGTARRQREQAN
jgi:AmiR/NasT family two-component response regulator